MAYKVKTTAPEHYRVKPTVGVIEAGQTVEVSVQLTPGRYGDTGTDILSLPTRILPLFVVRRFGAISTFSAGISFNFCLFSCYSHA